ncbi:MAG: hypothetical protein COS11_03760 [bacterium (Candidatus Ratteibacteria) CG01_land_8_20_14_3_00_40_19]|uniref:CdsD C-terminal domain-containing protein n=1 Tax=bacterium (Candidatus Ratteibacteria) CG01_land_8_20_14_3_00_40_19 TaxID=2014290 RepID=A0A2M7E8V5_9BACT|nr:MAG: hypothetical protein COS11_03760 [bacterium (Candidatus Ratteibacteria) CG01_land_8_20_14_3_00_40_19]PIW74229.1 MAG: hypothetical protein CO004_01750 [bacterium (Candidatus Ratteibacteria) CG_4_8_14_3_um_filter_41_36]
MTKEQRELIITIGLIFILVIALSTGFKKIKKHPEERKTVKKEISVSKDEKSAEVPEKKQASKEVWEMQLARWNQNWKRDPFLLSAEKEEEKKSILREFSFSLSGIVWKEKKLLALIDDYIVKTGDIIDGYMVLEITENKVVLEKDGKEYQLFLKKK